MKKILTIIISILFLATVGLGSYGLMYSYFSKKKVNDNPSSSVSEIVSSNVSSSTEISTSETSSTEIKKEPEETVEEKREKIGCAAYEKYLKSFLNSEDTTRKILDYEIISCAYVEPPQEYREEYGISDERFLISVTSNIKPYDINTSGWIPGADVKIEGEWIKRKWHFAKIKKENEEYKVETTFTGW